MVQRKSVGAPVADVTAQVNRLFQEAQNSLLQHKRLVQTLYGLLQNSPRREFRDALLRNVGLVLCTKKSEAAGDKIVRLIAAFVQHVSDKMQDDTVEESAESGFVPHLIGFLLHGTDTKDKVVRFRVCQIIANCINGLGEIDESLYQKLVNKLLRRMSDKESSVRLQAALALCRLQGSEDEIAEEITSCLLNSLQHDPSAEVRRGVLVNIEQTPATLPYILERARDVDSINRRMVYSKCMKELGNFKYLSIKKRERLLRWGIEDRDATVHKAASKMFAFEWIKNADNNIIELVERLDVTRSEIASKALHVFFQEREDVASKIEFSEEFWTNLTPEAALLVRIYNDHCRDSERGPLHDIDSKMPEMTRLGFYIDQQLEKLDALLYNKDDQKYLDQSYIIEQMLAVAMRLDFSDEIGRRKMFALARQMLVEPRLPERIVGEAVKLLSLVAGGEKNLATIVLEVVSDLQDLLESNAGGDGRSSVAAESETSFHSARSNMMSPNSRIRIQLPKRQRLMSPMSDADESNTGEEIEVALLCLFIVQTMLISVKEGPEANPQLFNIFESLIVPCVRDHDATIRERGLVCLGQYSSLSINTAMDNLPLFGHCLSKGHESLQIVAIKTIADLIACHGLAILREESITLPTLQGLILKALSADDLPDLQATTCIAVAKLMLTSIINDEEILQALLALYFDPRTADNQTLRQSLSYFFPVYSYSVPAHQTLLARVAVAVFHKMCKLSIDLDEEEEMASLSSIMMQMVDWSNPSKLSHVAQASKASNAVLADHAAHAVFAIQACNLIASSRIRDERVTLCQVLPKLCIDESTPANMLCNLNESVEGIIENRTVSESAAKNALAKFQASLNKLIGDVKHGRSQTADRESIESWFEEVEQARNARTNCLFSYLQKTSRPLRTAKIGNPQDYGFGEDWHLMRLPDSLVVVHVCTTCDEHGVCVSKDAAEVIELAWVVIDTKTLEERHRESILIRPSNTPITDLCTSLTSLTWDHVRNADSFKEAIRKFDSFIEEQFLYAGKDVCFAALDAWDLRVQIPREARDKGVALPVYLQHPKVYELRSEYARWQAHHAEALPFSSSSLANICAALDVEMTSTRDLGQPQQLYPHPFSGGTPKRAIDEAINLSRVLVALVKRCQPAEKYPDVFARPLDAHADARAFVSERSKVLHLSGLVHDTTQSELESWFTQHGGRPIAFWTLRTPDQHKPTNTGFAVFSTHEEAAESLGMNGRALGDRAIEVSPSSSRVLDRAAEILTPFPPSKNRPRPGDWNCPSCGFSNFQRRTACFRCSFPASGAPAPDSYMGVYGYGNYGGPMKGMGVMAQQYGPNAGRMPNANGASGGNVPFRAGDWKCGSEGCNYHNFAKNMSCLRCGASRASAAMVADPMSAQAMGAAPQMSGYGGMYATPAAQPPPSSQAAGQNHMMHAYANQYAPPNYGPPMTSMNGTRSSGSNSPFSQFPPSSATSIGAPSSGGLNPMDPYGMRHGPGSAVNKVVPKNGDWECQCGFTNFQRRRTCLQCNLAQQGALPEMGMPQNNYPPAYQSMGPFGDEYNSHPMLPAGLSGLSLDDDGGSPTLLNNVSHAMGNDFKPASSLSVGRSPPGNEAEMLKV